MRILQTYVLRELSKTFALTTVGLTVLLSLGGGLGNILRAETVSSGLLAQILLLTLPGAFTMALPVAALFAAAMTFGRLSADNELNACRAAGINIHWLFLPAVGISLVVAVFVFISSQFIMPGLFHRLEDLVRARIETIVVNELSTRGHFEYQGTAISADSVTPLAPPPPGDAGATPAGHWFRILGAAYLERAGDKPARLATAESALAVFLPGEARPRIVSRLHNVRGFDLRTLRFYRLAEQPLGPYEIPLERLAAPLKPKWMTLPALLYYVSRPAELPEIAERLDALRRRIAAYRLAEQLVHRLATDPQGVTLGDESLRLRITAEQVRLNARTVAAELRGARVLEQRHDEQRVFEADRAYLTVRQDPRDATPRVAVELSGHVRAWDPGAPQRQVERADYRFPPLAVGAAPPDVPPPRTLVDPQARLDLAPPLDRLRTGLLSETSRQYRKIVGVLHSRFAFSLSVLAIVPLGAALGAIFRGSHVMTAFGISFAPGLFLIATIAMGRQLAEHPGTEQIGLATIWGALVALLIADAVVLARGVRR